MVELSTQLLAELGGWPALKEARLLVERHRVRDLSRDQATLRGRVQGAEKIHDARIVLADRVAQVEVHCTCVESRRSGLVCAHSLAVGLAHLQPQPAGPTPSPVRPVAPEKNRPRRWIQGEAPDPLPFLSLTFLLPLHLRESLEKDPVRVILEAQRDGVTSPWDFLAPIVENGYAVSEEDDRALAALERITGDVVGVNQVPRTQLGALLRALDRHPRVWLGKKQPVQIRASEEQTTLHMNLRPDGSLELRARAANKPSGSELPLPGWSLQDHLLIERPSLPPGFSTPVRMIPHAQIPLFLARDWPILEQTCRLIAPPEMEFRLETGTPRIEARLDGSLSGLTLDLGARYGDEFFSLSSTPETPAGYFPDPRKLHRFWRRNDALEKAVIAEIEADGFKPARSGHLFTLIHENQVTRFLANALPRWRRHWTILLGPRLESTLLEVDIAEPEFSLRSGSGEDWLSLDLKLTAHGKPIPLDASEIQRWLQTGQSHVRTADKRVLVVPIEAWREMREVLTDCAVQQEPGRIRVEKKFAPFLEEALTAEGFRFENAQGREAPTPEVQAHLEPALWAQLRPYQIEGVAWLASLAQRGLQGLLADDMGLGKTIQALAFCAWLRQMETRRSPALVVCPTSLVTNWLREAAKFTPHLRTFDLTGPDRAERLAGKAGADLLVTSYALLRRDLKQYRTEEFSLVILDEAQHIKNRSSQNAQAAKRLRARHRLVITGTPLENSVLDLWSLYDFLLPGYLGTAADFRERYETPLTRAPSPRTLTRLRRRVRPFFLRRTKEQVLPDLPPKLDFPTLCELTSEQREVYRAVLDQGRRDVFEKSGKSGGGRDRIAVLTTLLRLRQVCCHLDLLPVTNETKRVWEEPSAKLDRTFELIDEAIDGGHRVLLFSQFVRALHLLREEAKRRELLFCYLDGQTVERQEEVDRFQNDAGIPLFFISLKAGGTGLNLTGADTVIHFDPWWNPAVEEQATARAHRLGQLRAVQAYKLIAAGTVEEKIQALQARKRELFQASLGDEALVESLSGEELEELLAS